MKKLLFVALVSLPAYAWAEAPHGYRLDENGRPFQTMFDLRNRWLWGGGVVWDEDAALSGEVQTRAEIEDFDEWESHRDRHAFLEARLDFEHQELWASLYRFERSRQSREPQLWLTTFVGEPRRFDIPINVGPLFSLAAVHRTQAYLDIDVASLGFHWTMAQSGWLEDFVRLEFEAAGGMRLPAEVDEVKTRLAPHALLAWRWSPGERGLWEFSGSIGVQASLVADADASFAGVAQVEVERVLIAINDQPISLYVQGQAHHDGDLLGWRGTSGLRVSFFSPPPPPPDKCPGEQEDFDGFEDDDGCADPDNDRDGVADSQDACPNDAGPGNGCPGVQP